LSISLNHARLLLISYFERFSMIITLWYFALTCLIGLAVGSFINAFEYRLHEKIDFISKRSMCTHCKHELKALDLIPLISYFFLRGKCRYCETKVSWQYPIVEFLSGCLFLIAAFYTFNQVNTYELIPFLQMLMNALFHGLLFSFFLFIALYDVKHGIIPNKVIIPAFILSLVINLLIAAAMHFYPDIHRESLIISTNVAWNMLAGFMGAVFIAFIIIITKGKGMGGGDLKLVAVMGLLLGMKNLIIALYIAVILGSIGGILWGLHKGRIKGLTIPFGLFLSIGSILSFLLGEVLWDYFFGGFEYLFPSLLLGW